MRIVFFLLETFFFFLVAAALLRAWMNHLRIHMSGQPGRFAIAVTNWLVAPVRRVLPSSLAQSRIDWGSLLAAVLLCLAYGVVWLLLASSVSSAPLSMEAAVGTVGTMAVRMLVRTLLQGLMLLLLGYAILSWVQPHSPVMAILERLCSPLLRPIRRVIPLVGGVDLSVLVLIILLQVGLMLLG
ncbi:YggT family protein [Hydrogenophaga sp. BPS33]|uniref:YggT family protein n=1 Tax=Hydrogenophaga sp. BPS33 TaxID=2651974 RepID=UPI00131F97C5|nr:YggT family protein [Hydrogenophaga sp. BPS33]QHE85770.1 YggT family protein [Hydrogenophaga sp. BPS33]